MVSPNQDIYILSSNTAEERMERMQEPENREKGCNILFPEPNTVTAFMIHRSSGTYAGSA